MLALTVFFTAAAGTGFAQTTPTEQPKKPEPAPGGEAKPAEPKTEGKTATPAGTAPRVKLETTLGPIVLELDAVKAPISTANFLQYVNDKFYDGTVFHRVIPNFMIQGGGYDPELNEKKQGLRQPIRNEWTNGLKNVRGTIAMARTSVADSATAQFFINVVDNPNLDKPDAGGAAYAVFGKVVEGLENVDKIRNTETKADPKYPGGKVVPVTPVLIQSAKVIDAGPASEAKKPG